MRVYILVTVPRADLLDSCTLVFKTLRVGFPTSEVWVYINDDLCAEGTAYTASRMALESGCSVSHECEPVHHAEWIRRVIEEHLPADGPCVILDADTIFWKSCENWKFETPLAGFHVPLMWNDFAQCISFERLHTSFLWIQDVDLLFKRIKEAYPNAGHPTGMYCPVEPFMPRVQFINGIPFFWDSTAALYNMIGGTPFSTEQLSHYEHLNSAAFYDVMHERLENKTGFELLHKHFVKDPSQLRNLWQCVHPYYAQKHQQALDKLRSMGMFGAPTLQKLAPVLR